MLDRKKAAELLRKGADLVDGPRAETHDPDGRQMDMAAALISAFLGVTVTQRDACIIMSLVKMSRARCGDAAHEDHYVDGAAYMAMAGACQ